MVALLFLILITLVIAVVGFFLNLNIISNKAKLIKTSVDTLSGRVVDNEKGVKDMVDRLNNLTLKGPRIDVGKLKPVYIGDEMCPEYTEFNSRFPILLDNRTYLALGKRYKDNLIIFTQEGTVLGYDTVLQTLYIVKPAITYTAMHASITFNPDYQRLYAILKLLCDGKYFRGVYKGDSDNTLRVWTNNKTLLEYEVNIGSTPDKFTMKFLHNYGVMDGVYKS